MKKLGFTLAEVLIALAIIGVVAAMTLPNLINEYQKDVWAKSLSVAVSDFERAMGAMIMRDGVNDLTETEAWKYVLKETELFPHSNSENIEGFVKKLKDTLKIDEEYQSCGDFYKNIVVKKLNGNVIETSDGFFDEFIALTGKNNIVYLISIPTPEGDANKTESDILSAGGNLYKAVGELHIDVNGNKKPNTVGKDIFYFKIDVNGNLYSYGGKDYSIWYNGDDSYTWQKKCSDSDKEDSWFCTGRLIENGYKMDY